MSKNYDIAIVGGGNAGLNLAKRLTQSNAPKKIIVIEPIAAINKQANWCSWHNEESLKKNSSSIKGIWDKWRIIDQNNVIECQLKLHLLKQNLRRMARQKLLE